MTRQDLIDFCLTFPAAYEDYPFDDITQSDHPWTVMRHRGTKKGFAHIYERGGCLCVNLKCDPLEADLLRSAFRDVTSAYHMNKTHWNTVRLGGDSPNRHICDVPEEELRRMIGKSYDLTKPKQEGQGKTKHE
jgi:predicted DNA-binding protein (MmcQ/YjbR family)